MSTFTARRATALAQAATGAAVLIRPEAAITLVARNGSHPAAWIVRVLGARMLGQGCAIAVRPTRPVVLAGAGVDIVHAVSMVWIGRQAQQYRRPALASALTAMAFAVAAVGTSGTTR